MVNGFDLAAIMEAMDSLDEILSFIHSQNPPPQLIAVSKTKSQEQIREAFEKGIRSFGENRVQEFLTKRELLSDLPIHWHFIGGLQSNKVRSLAGKVDLFHGLDSRKLFRKLTREGTKISMGTPSLIQVNISRESQKGGVLPEELEGFCRDLLQEENEFCPIRGLMCIGSSLESVGESRVQEEFKEMQRLFQGLDSLKSTHFRMEFLSMGMSSDFRLALKYGSNMIRVGRAIFGARDIEGYV